MSKSFAEYKQETTLDIQECLRSMQCQPILFVGSGSSRRYLDAPDWHGLLKAVASKCPLLGKQYAYYKQRIPEAPDIATEFASTFHEWAWGDGREHFPSSMFEKDTAADTYLKYIVSHYLQSLTPDDTSAFKAEHKEELQHLRRITPHAVITTNYDSLLEKIYCDYTPIIGEAVIRGGGVNIGEILKIHGCVSSPHSLVLTRADYERFENKNKYLNAKLLTYFAEHPLLFIGYSASDPNIRSVLSDLDMILSPDGQVMQNVYLLTWNKNAESTTNLPHEEMIPVGDGRRVRVKNIVADGFSWVFEAFSHRSPLQGINTKILRAFSARMMKLVRTDFTSPLVQVNYSTLESLVPDDNLPHLLGLGSISDPSAINFNYPHTLTSVGKKLGSETWHVADKLLKKIKEETGVDLRASDNSYHITVKAGAGHVKKYSDKLVALLEKVQKGEEYEIDGQFYNGLLKTTIAD